MRTRAFTSTAIETAYEGNCPKCAQTSAIANRPGRHRFAVFHGRLTALAPAKCMLSTLAPRCWLALPAARRLPNIRPLVRSENRPGGRRQGRSSSPRLAVMLLDFEVQRCSRRCAATDRALEPGDMCYSVLEVNGAEVVRKDFQRGSLERRARRRVRLVEVAHTRTDGKENQAGPQRGAAGIVRSIGRPAGPNRSAICVDVAARAAARAASGRGVGQSIPDTRHATSRQPCNEMMRVYCPKRDATYDVAVNMPSGATDRRNSAAAERAC